MLVDINKIKLTLWIDVLDLSKDDIITLMYDNVISYINWYVLYDLEAYYNTTVSVPIIIPKELQQAIIKLSAAFYKDNEKVDTKGIKSETVNWDSISYMWKVDQINNSDKAFDETKTILDKYTLITY